MRIYRQNLKMNTDLWVYQRIARGQNKVVKDGVEGKPHLLLQNRSNLIGLALSSVEGETLQRLLVQEQLVEGLGKPVEKGAKLAGIEVSVKSTVSREGRRDQLDIKM